MKPSLSSLKVDNILFQLNNVKPENSSPGSRPASACSRLMLPFQVTFVKLEAKKHNHQFINQSESEVLLHLSPLSTVSVC